jgi:hypothetical protein
MKLLWMGSSNDVNPELPAQRLTPALVVDRLERELGTSIEMETRNVWPSARLPSLVERWVAETGPDLAVMKTRAYSFCYESVPLKVQRMLGPLGKPIADAGLRAADTSFGRSRVFHAGRNLLHRTIGGSTYFEPEEVIPVFAECIRMVVRGERATLLVRGPVMRTDTSVTAAGRKRVEDRRLKVHRALAAECERLHVAYWGEDGREEYRAGTLGDRLHMDEGGHELEAAGIAERLLAALREGSETTPG